MVAMNRIFIILILLFSSNSWAENVNGFEIEPINCIAALSIGRDASETTGDSNMLRLLTDVQNKIYLLLPDFPKYSLIQSKKRAIGSKATEIVLACVEKYN